MVPNISSDWLVSPSYPAFLTYLRFQFSIVRADWLFWRLLLAVNLPEMISHTKMEPEIISIVQDHVAKMLEWASMWQAEWDKAAIIFDLSSWPPHAWFFFVDGLLQNSREWFSPPTPILPQHTKKSTDQYDAETISLKWQWQMIQLNDEVHNVLLCLFLLFQIPSKNWMLHLPHKLRSRQRECFTPLWASTSKWSWLSIPRLVKTQSTHEWESILVKTCYFTSLFPKHAFAIGRFFVSVLKTTSAVPQCPTGMISVLLEKNPFFWRGRLCWQSWGSSQHAYCVFVMLHQCSALGNVPGLLYRDPHHHFNTLVICSLAMAMFCSWKGTLQGPLYKGFGINASHMSPHPRATT
jgi:hypothetical protein